MAAKLKPSAVAALTMLRDHADDWINAGFPGNYWWTFEPSYVADVWAGFSPATLRSLVQKGLAEFKPGYEKSYWIRITDAGRLAAEAAEDPK